MEPIAASWLARCCERFDESAISAAVLHFEAAGEAVAAWPDPDDGDVPELLGASGAAFASRRIVVRPREKGEDGTPTTGRLLAVPIELGARRTAVATFVCGSQDAAELQALASGIQDAGQWLPLLLSSAGGGKAGSADLLVRLAATVLEAEDANSASLALVSEIATVLACERVSLGFVEGGNIELAAVSHSARFDARSRLGRALAEAMEEAVDAEDNILWPGDPALGPRRAHQTLCEQHEIGCAISVPLTSNGRAIGAITIEYRVRHPAAAAVAARLGQIATLLGPLLALRHRDSRPLAQTLAEGVRERIELWSGEEKKLQRLALGLAAIVILLLAVVPGTVRIAAPARLEGLVQRAIVAPIDGYVAESRARAGDVVTQGDILGRLDDSDLRLEQRKWSARRAQLEKEYRGALALGDRAEARIVSARLAEARAELDLVELQLDRTHLVAPFDGVVAEGDLSRELGSPIERGQVLFQIAPLDRYRIVLEVPETEIDQIAVGQGGFLKLTAQPGEALALSVMRIVPVATARDGRNFFRVEAVLAEQQSSLRPGMEGVGKIEAGRRSLLWIHTHQLVDWLRLNLWAYLP